MKKLKIFAVLLVSILIGAGVWFVDAARKEPPAKTVYIETPQELQAFSREVNAGRTYKDIHVVLTNDLDMSGISDFVPIGEWGQDNIFCGVFDGDGHTISNLTMIGDEDANLGLFGTLGGKICNLTIENCTLQGNACGAFCSIAGSDEAAILNCAVRNANIDALHTDIIGGQYFGEKQNCVVDGQGDLEELDSNLRGMWRMLDMIPVNCWTMGENGLALTREKKKLPSRIYLTLEDSYEGEILPVLYAEEEDCDVFCVPGVAGGKTAAVILEFPDGSLEKEKITLSDAELITVQCDDGLYNVRLLISENTGAVFLDTGMEGGLDYLRGSRENMLPGIVHVLDENGNTQYVGRAERIRGRGNDSWFSAAKQGFGFKLEKSGNILGMGDADNYALVAGYRNASLLTYQMIWDLCKEMEWENALEYRMVQLYIDGEYWGLYFLTEKIEAGPERIPVEERGDESGGFVFEYAMLDYKEQDARIVTERENSYVITSPAIPSQKQQLYCRRFLDEMEAALYSEDGYNELGRHYTEYIDMESWAAQWLFYEAMGEISTESSVYFYKDADGTENEKMYALYPWDVEHSCVFFREEGVVDFPRNNLWNAAAAHEEFREEVRRQWEERFLPALEKMLQEEPVENPGGISSLGYYVKQMEVASGLNELRWGDDQDMGVKAENIRYWMDRAIPYLNEKLYQDSYYLE